MENSSSNQERLRKAVHAAANGKRTEPRAVLRETVIEDPKNLKAWLWLAYTASSIEEKRAALYHALQLEPDNEKVQAELKKTLQPKHIQAAAERGAFVCYSRADELFAVELAEQIKMRNLPAWIDMLDMPNDADWNLAITEALQQSGVILLILSANMLTSEDVLAELEYSLSQGKVVLPLLHRACNWQSLDLPHPPIDFRDNPMSGLRKVLALLGILSVPTQR